MDFYARWAKWLETSKDTSLIIAGEPVEDGMVTIWREIEERRIKPAMLVKVSEVTK